MSTDKIAVSSSNTITAIRLAGLKQGGRITAQMQHQSEADSVRGYTLLMPDTVGRVVDVTALVAGMLGAELYRDSLLRLEAQIGHPELYTIQLDELATFLGRTIFGIENAVKVRSIEEVTYVGEAQ